MKWLLLFTLLTTACSYEFDEKDRLKTFKCKDFRDGEIFEFHGTSARNARYRPEVGLCYDVTDFKDKEHTLCHSHELFIKCEEIR